MNRTASGDTLIMNDTPVLSRMHMLLRGTCPAKGRYFIRDARTLSSRKRLTITSSFDDCSVMICSVSSCSFNAILHLLRGAPKGALHVTACSTGSGILIARATLRALGGS